ncbi:MAG: hypothetical protein HQL66_13225 [Magnetococcales bacterium]|nr:hypothetical protein [Magnetococcales bacterium]
MTTLDMITSHVARLPEALQVELLHYVLFLEQRIVHNQTARQTREERQRSLAESLESAARLHPFQGISDPVTWQRDIRQDRPLPGREENPC